MKQWVASVSASFDQFVSKIENHEAVADSVIADVRKGAARLRAQRSRIEAELRRHRAAQAQSQRHAETWQQRAVAIPEAEESKALECVARAEQERARAERLRQQIAQSEAVVADISAALNDVETQLAQLKLKKSTLASRNTRADVLAVSQDLGFHEEVDSVFERWEQSVIEKEYAEDVVLDGGTDAFEQPFEKAEREADLKARLAALRKGEA